MSNKSLIIVPIIHTRADFGSLESRVPVDQEYENMAVQYWQLVSEYAETLSVDFSTLRVYQDGLPNTLDEIVAKIIDETQTPNYNLLRYLRKNGAKIIGTENPALLLQEYTSLQAIFQAENEEQKHVAQLSYARISAYILEERDEYIAQSVRNTLPEGGTGLLFMGLAHRVNGLLEQEMNVTEPEGLISLLPEGFQNKLHGKEREL